MTDASAGRPPASDEGSATQADAAGDPADRAAPHAADPAELRGDVDWSGGGTVLAFMNEVAGGRRLLSSIRARVEAGADRVAVVAPQNQPTVGQIVNRDEAAVAARSRVEVTEAVLEEFGIPAVGAVLDPDSSLALDDATRAFEPREVLLSCLAETRFGLMRRDLVSWAQHRLEVPVTHVPVRIDDDAVRWDVTHTLVVATRTVNSPELVSRLLERAAERPHRYTFISPASGDVTREQVCDDLARTLAAVYREEIDATGQPMSPEPMAAVRNAVEHYRIDEILISTLSGQSSRWLAEGLVEKARDYSGKEVEHVEVGAQTSAAEHDRGRSQEPVGAAPAGAGTGPTGATTGGQG